MKPLFLLCCIFFTLHALANDAPVSGVSGRVKRLTGKHPSVQMVRETVRMDIYPTYYDVDATFDFLNDGPECSVKMGFPEQGGGGIDSTAYHRKSSFISFRTWVDGSVVPARRQQTDISDDTDGFLTYWVKEVVFAAGQRRAVRVAYRSNVGDRYLDRSTGSEGLVFGHFARYNFTGSNWKGLVEESTLRVIFHLPGAYAVRYSETIMTPEKDGFTHVWKNWRAEHVFLVEFYPTRTDALALCGLELEGYPPGEPEKAGEVMVSLQPDKGPAPAWQPPVLLRNGRPFIAAQCWADYLNYPHGRYKMGKDANQHRVALAWDGTHTVTISQDGRTARFTLKGTEMVVDGQKPVPLPEGPFLSRPLGKVPGLLYVPLQPLAALFGGTIDLDPVTRVVAIKLPATPDR